MASWAFGFLSRAHLRRGFGLRAFQARVRRWFASDFEKTPLDKVQPGRARGYSRSKSEIAFEREK